MKFFLRQFGILRLLIFFLVIIIGTFWISIQPVFSTDEGYEVPECKDSPTPSSSPTPEPTATAISEPTTPPQNPPTTTPTPTNTPLISDVCPNIEGIQTSLPTDYHFDNDGVNCLKFELGGPPPPPAVGLAGVADSGQTAQILGASTLAGTGTAEENIMYIIFSIGTFISSVGIMRSGQKKVSY